LVETDRPTATCNQDVTAAVVCDPTAWNAWSSTNASCQDWIEGGGVEYLCTHAHRLRAAMKRARALMALGTKICDHRLFGQAGLARCPVSQPYLGASKRLQSPICTVCTLPVWGESSPNFRPTYDPGICMVFWSDESSMASNRFFWTGVVGCAVNSRRNRQFMNVTPERDTGPPR
jgi:hypothetical protein